MITLFLSVFRLFLLLTTRDKHNIFKNLFLLIYWFRFILRIRLKGP